MKKHTGESTRAGEHCWVLTGALEGEYDWRFQRRHPSSGTPGSVEADWEWALRREERYGDVVGFYHTHPRGAGAHPSARDIRTMDTWVSALGKPLLCLIANGKAVNGYVFTRDERQGIPVESILKGERGRYTAQVRGRKMEIK